MVGQTGRGGKEKCSNRAAHTVARAGDRSMQMQPMSETPHASRRKAPAADCLCLQAAARRAFRPSPSWERACDRQESTQRRGASSSCRLGVRAGPVSRDPWAGPGRRMGTGPSGPRPRPVAQSGSGGGVSSLALHVLEPAPYLISPKINIFRYPTPPNPIS